MPEEKFVPGVDPGLKAWLKMRQDVRDARSKGTNTYTITSEIPYKYHYHWIDLLFAFDEEDFKKLLSDNSISEGSWGKAETKNVCTNDEYEGMLLMSPRDKEKLYYYAIYHRSLVLLTKLIEREGCNINYRFTRLKRTLLQLAVQHGDLLKVTYLLQHQASVSTKDIHKRTALHLAMHSDSIFHSIDIPRMLIEAGAVVNVQDEHGRTPLHYACLVGNPHLARLLLENGADMTMQDEKSKMALEYTSQVSPRVICLILMLTVSTIEVCTCGVR